MRSKSNKYIFYILVSFLAILFIIFNNNIIHITYKYIYNPYKSEINKSYLDSFKKIREPHNEIYDLSNISKNYNSIDFNYDRMKIIRENFVLNDKNNYTIYNKTGYANIIDCNYTFLEESAIVINKKLTINNISLLNRYGDKIKLYHGIPRNRIYSDISILMLNGRNTNIDNMFGINNIIDYTRNVALKYCEAGFNVYALDISSDGKNINFERGLTSYGIDISNVLDAIKYIKSKESLVILGGISYGAHISEIIGSIENDIVAVLSIGGSARNDMFHFTLNKNINTDNEFDFQYNYFCKGVPILKKIFPKQLMISIGTRDHGVQKISILNDLIKYYDDNSGSIYINLFKGYHESDPIGEIEMLKKVSAKLLIK